MKDKQYELTPEELKKRLSEINDHQRDMANTTEGDFKQEDMDNLFFDGLLSLLNDKLAKADKRRENILIIKGTEHTEEFTKHRLDRPDREKIEFQVAMAMNTALEIEKSTPVALKAAEWQDKIHKARKDITDQILALFDEEEIRKLKAEIEALHRGCIGEVWYWQGDGEDNIESLTCPILIEASDLREFKQEVWTRYRSGLADTLSIEVEKAKREEREMTLREVGEQLGDVLRDFSKQKREPGHPTSYWAGYHYARNLLQHYISALKQSPEGD